MGSLGACPGMHRSNGPPSPASSRSGPRLSPDCSGFCSSYTPHATCGTGGGISRRLWPHRHALWQTPPMQAGIKSMWQTYREWKRARQQCPGNLLYTSRCYHLFKAAQKAFGKAGKAAKKCWFQARLRDLQLLLRRVTHVRFMRGFAPWPRRVRASRYSCEMRMVNFKTRRCSSDSSRSITNNFMLQRKILRSLALKGAQFVWMSLWML